MSKSQNLVKVEEQDYLEQDPPIRGQKYVCLSFISPEDVIKNKDAFYMEKFLGTFSKDMNELWSNMLSTFKDNIDFCDSLRLLQERYKYLFYTDRLQDEFTFFKNNHSESLESEYHEKNDFQTSIRGLKVRGSYDSIKEAQIRAQVLKRMDDKFNVYIAEVGCWCPWSPNPEDIEDQEYAETHLNTLMKNYKNNQKMKDEFYEKRKETLKSLAEEKNKILSDISQVNDLEDQHTKHEEHMETIKEDINEDDIWQKRKQEQEDVNIDIENLSTNTNDINTSSEKS